jgi:hypothetical protein
MERLLNSLTLNAYLIPMETDFTYLNLANTTSTVLLMVNCLSRIRQLVSVSTNSNSNGKRVDGSSGTLKIILIGSDQ